MFYVFFYHAIVFGDCERSQFVNDLSRVFIEVLQSSLIVRKVFFFLSSSMSIIRDPLQITIKLLLSPRLYKAKCELS